MFCGNREGRLLQRDVEMCGGEFLRTKCKGEVVCLQLLKSFARDRRFSDSRGPRYNNDACRSKRLAHFACESVAGNMKANPARPHGTPYSPAESAGSIPQSLQCRMV